ncbi:MAG TPA: RHS repeat-associated core domain-containing protein [Chryseosolibacter sp.]|nr:RHS repeat-associated core domain-containing protein [Chryseosolibacter sp.]
MIVSSSDYYPFGLKFNSFERENSVEQRWRFQGQEHINDLGLNWESFKWRNHQPDIGRFFNVDPLASDFPQWSPYVFCGNMVTVSKELEGMEPDFMIHGKNGIRELDNRVTMPMSTLLSTAFGFSPESISKTVWYRDNDARAHWFARKVVPNNATAITFGDR